jgi:nitroimidazol reductase NimA-like FMN-containing flavoprotein (pyridoxamine 5'-phosphate oxidase superfamily)
MSEQRASRLQELTRDECIELLRSYLYFGPGHIGYVVDGAPVILPVNFVVDGESVVFCTAKGSKLSWLSKHSRVAFEVDHGRPLDHSGWSVLVRGSAHEVTDPDELDTLRQGPLHSWAVPSAEHWIRISLDEISGRRLDRRGIDGSPDRRAGPPRGRSARRR